MSSVLLLGFVIGLRHALEADHLAAVASLATRTRSLRRALRLGALWGLGHSLTLLLVGGGLLLADRLVPARAAILLEGLVGLLLMVLGLDVICRAVRERVHFHRHRHGTLEHFHAHSHAGEGSHADSANDHGHDQGLSGRAVLIGLLHGLAGSAALILLAAGRLPSPWWGLVYILLFGLGSILGMALMSCVVSFAPALDRASSDLGPQRPDRRSRPVHSGFGCRDRMGIGPGRSRLNRQLQEGRAFAEQCRLGADAAVDLAAQSRTVLLAGEVMAVAGQGPPVVRIGILPQQLCGEGRGWPLGKGLGPAARPLRRRGSRLRRALPGRLLAHHPQVRGSGLLCRESALLAPDSLDRRHRLAQPGARRQADGPRAP